MILTTSEIKERRYLKLGICLFVILQISSWVFTSRFTPFIGILDEVPTLNEAKIAALGDEQFYFRYQALNLQNSGDSFGRFTALKNYDYKVLKKWMNLLDEMDSISNFVPSIAAYYYSNTQNVADNIYIVEYLESNYDLDPKAKWWWLGMAVNIADFKLKDDNLALRLAFKLASTPNAKMPRWAQEMPAIIYAKMGEKQLAMEIMKDIAIRQDDYDQGEINFMNNFIKERLGYFKESVAVKPRVQSTIKPMYKD